MTGERLSHAYIVASPSVAARAEKAREIAAAMLCEAVGARPCGSCRHCRKSLNGIHPDLITVSRETDDKGRKKREIYVRQIRWLSADAVVLPNEAARKVYLIEDAETMNTEAQNALLKLLEEPPAHVGFVLCASNAGGLLPTVRSRCVELSLSAAADKGPESARADALVYLAAAEKRVASGLLSCMTALAGKDNAEAREFCAAVREECAGRLCRGEGASLSRAELMELIALMDRVDEYLRVNTGVKHVFGLIAARTPGMRNKID